MNDRPEDSASHESAPGLASPARFSLGDVACLSGSVALTLAAYASALAVPFLWDDGILLGAARSLTDPLQAFAQPFFARDWGSFYRPLTTLSFAGGLALSGASPVAFHATNVAPNPARPGRSRTRAGRAGGAPSSRSTSRPRSPRRDGSRSSGDRGPSGNGRPAGAGSGRRTDDRGNAS